MHRIAVVPSSTPTDHHWPIGVRFRNSVDIRIRHSRNKSDLLAVLPSKIRQNRAAGDHLLAHFDDLSNLLRPPDHPLDPAPCPHVQSIVKVIDDALPLMRQPALENGRP